ncbi:MAG: TolC family protein, partial [Muribaculaceae bacterium]|nr:TolC family protein [Muribaculaceae bacterium]
YKKVLAESQEAFTVAIDRYKRGLSSFTDVMNAQISMLDYENTLLETRAAALTSLVKVYAAVAGNPQETGINSED